MTWSLVKITEVPLGCRILSYGDRGEDVVQLQNLLRQAGFYSGISDGYYGAITEEGILQLQSSSFLRRDGIAGPQTLKSLSKFNRDLLVYRVRAREDLKSISQRFGVSPAAWRAFRHHGNPQRHTYPGMQLFLPEKALFTWDDVHTHSGNFPVTGKIRHSGQITAVGDLQLLNPELNTLEYHLFSLTPAAWESILIQPKIWPQIATQLAGHSGLKIGLDLREAPLEAILLWTDFIKSICAGLKRDSLSLLLLPLLPLERSWINRLYWSELSALASHTNLLTFEPQLALATPNQFLASAKSLHNALHSLNRRGLAAKSVLLTTVSGWIWHLAPTTALQKCTYREARLIRAMHSAAADYHPESDFTVLNYLNRQEPQTLIYCDWDGWQNRLRRLANTSLQGIAIHNFQALGKEGPRLIANSFKVLPAKRL